jgi:hypothetical protein
MDTSPVLLEAEERQSRILDANYDRVDPDDFVRGLTHLSVNEQKELSTEDETSIATFLRYGEFLPRHVAHAYRKSLRAGTPKSLLGTSTCDIFS